MLQGNYPYCLEIGFATGRSTITILAAARPNRMVSIDTDLDYMDAGRKHAEQIMGVFKNLQIIEGKSQDLLTDDFFKKHFPKGIDFALIDGGHELHECLADLEAVWSKINKNGLVVVDDYKSGPPDGVKCPGVIQAVDRFASERKIHISEWYKRGKGMACLRKGDGDK